MAFKQLALLATVSLIAACLISDAVSAKECRLEKQAELPLGYTNGLATVQAKINGMPVSMGLDTGAQTVITPDISDSLKLEGDWRRTRVIGTTAIFTVRRVIVRDFEFAGLHFTDKSFQKIALPKAKGFDGAKTFNSLGGLIGMDLLGDYELDFDFPHRKLTLYKAGSCAKVTPPDFSEPAVIPFKVNLGRNILLPLELNGTKLTAILDTGATLHAISRSAITGKVGVTEAMLKADFANDIVGIGNVITKQPFHPVKTLTIGGATFNNIYVGVVSSSFNQAEMLIGQTYLFAQRFWVSNATQTLFVDKVKTPFNVQAASWPAHAVSVVTPGMGLCNAFSDMQKAGVCGQQIVQRFPSDPIEHTPQLGDVAGRFVSYAAPKIQTPPSPAAAAPPSPESSGFLGVGERFITHECLRAMQTPLDTAVIIARFSPVSVGQKAGLQLGDIITAINDKPVNSSSFKAEIRAIGASQKATIKVLRGANEVSIEVVLDAFRDRAYEMFDPAVQAAHEIEAERLILSKLPLGEGCAVDRAISQMHLGAAYIRYQPPAGSGDDRFEIAIKYLEQGLAGLDGGKYPLFWGAGQISLGDAYRLRSAGDRTLNAEKAVQAYQAVLLANNFETLASVHKWRIFVGLGQAILNRSAKTQSENIERAIDMFRKAIELPDSKVSMKDKADVFRALADAYTNRLEGVRDQNLSQALFSLQMASTYYQASQLTAEKDATLALITRLKEQQKSLQR